MTAMMNQDAAAELLERVDKLLQEENFVARLANVRNADELACIDSRKSRNIKHYNVA